MLEPYELETEIIPSPGTSIPDWDEMEKKIEVIKQFTNKVHIDVVDGKFAPNITFADPTPFSKYTKDMIFEVHLMVDDPISHLDKWAKAGFLRFIAQIEKMPDVPSFVAKAQSLGDVGLAIDTPTDAAKLFPYLNDIDVAFVMTVKAGLSRQDFMPEMLEKAKAFREKVPFLPIEVDGGINPETIVDAKKAGVTRFVTTGYLFDSQNPLNQYVQLKQVVEL